MGGWIVFGIQIASYMDLVVGDKIPFSVSECPFNATLPEPQEQPDINPVFLMSYHWTNPVGVGTTLPVGVIGSTKPTKLEEINMDYLELFTHRFLKEEKLSDSFASLCQNRKITLSLLLETAAIAVDGSYVYGDTILGTVSKIYYYGTQYSLIAVAIIAMAFPVAYTYVPVLCTRRAFVLRVIFGIVYGGGFGPIGEAASEGGRLIFAKYV
ncbi:hypothetical protein GQX74_009471 [Glossina fuscipes]|nr:hypothetical protein GQX74_009471 [Glossina fuscipes]